MATVYTRAGKGSALTWTEADANTTNLNTAKIENVVEDTTPQLGGNLDTNGNKILGGSYGGNTIELPLGFGPIITSGYEDAVTIQSSNNNTTFKQWKFKNDGTTQLPGFKLPATDGTANQVLKTDGSGIVTWATPSSGGIANVIEDTTPQLGGDLDVNGHNITSVSNGNVNISPNGSGNIALTPTTGKIILGALDFPTGMGTNGQVLTTNGSTAMTWSTPTSGGLTDVVNDTTPQLGGALDVNGNAIVSASNGNIAITPNGTGSIQLDGLNWPQADGTNGQVLSTNGTAQLSWTTVSGGASTLDGLSDVVLGTPATGEVLYFNGTNWIDTPASGLTVSAASTATTAATATTVTLVATNTTSAEHYITFTDAATGNENIRTDTGLVYNPSTGILGATQFNGIHSGAHNGTVGATTPNTGAFTSLTASSTVSGTGITALFTSPTGIGSTTPNTGQFTGLTVRGATNTAKLTLDTTAVSSTAWTTTGIGLRVSAATFTDSTSLAGTVAASHVNAIATPTIASTNIITVTDAGTVYIADGPTAGTNTTITNKWALLTAGNIKAANMTLTGALTGAHNGTVGATTPNTGAFTTLSASGVATLGGTALPSATGTTGQVLALSSAGTAAWTTASSGGSSIIAFSHNNTGTVISGNIKRMTIAEYVDTGSLITVSGDQFTLPAGTYLIENPVYPNLTSATSIIEFYNVTNSARLYRAVVDNPFGTSTAYWGAPGTGHFTLTGTKTVELRITTTLTSGSLPTPYSFTGSAGAGNYCDWVIIKVA